jgi:hypothetical protein
VDFALIPARTIASVDYLTQRYLAVANRLAGELRRAAIALESVSSRIQSQIESAARQPEPTRNEIHFLPEDTTRYYAEQKKSYRLQWWTLGVGTVTLIALAVAALFTYQQWQTMKNTYVEIQEQTGSAQTAANAARDSTELAYWALLDSEESSYLTLQQMQAQTVAQKVSANTARDALVISERAYLAIADPRLDIDKQNVSIGISNSGRLPSGPVEVTHHEATFNLDSGNTLVRLDKAIERHWKRTKLQSVPPGTPIAIKVVIPKMDKGRLENGLQTVIVAGVISYNDGFPNTQTRHANFCVQSMYSTSMKILVMSPCSEEYLKPLELLDGYPNNEEP